MIPARTAGVTSMLAVALKAPTVAVSVTVPVFSAVRTPLSEIAAIVESLLVHAASLVTSRLLLSV